MKIYNIKEGQLIILWIFGAFLWGWVSGMLFSILGFLGFFLSFLIFVVLFFYSVRWKDYRKRSPFNNKKDELDNQPKKVATILIGIVSLAFILILSLFVGNLFFEDILGNRGPFLFFLIPAALIFYTMWRKLG